MNYNLFNTKRLFAIVAFVAACCLDVSAFELSSVKSLYLVGDAVQSGWNRNSAPELQQPTTGVYLWSGKLKAGEFKFLISRSSWSSLNADIPDQPVTLFMPMNVWTNDEGADHDFKWIIPTAGKYTLRVDVVHGTLTVSTFGEDSAVAIDMVNTGYGQHKYCEPTRTGRFRVKAVAGQTERYVMLCNDGQHFDYTENPGFASIFAVEQPVENTQLLIDANAKTLAHNDFTPWTDLYLTGSFNNWSFTPAVRDVDDPNVFHWQGRIDINKGTELKFMGTTNFGNADLQLHPFTAREPLLSANHVVQGGVDNKWRVNKSDEYNITIDPFRLTVKVMDSAGVDVEAASPGSISVVTTGHHINVSAPEDCFINIYDICGRLIASRFASEVEADVAPGVYVVTAPGQAVKVLVAR